MKYIFDGMDISGVKVTKPYERVLKVIFSPEIGNNEKCTVLFSIISPQNSTGNHIHDVDEIMYVASGRGIGKVGTQIVTVTEDFFIFSPKDVEHEVKNTGDETLKLICFFIPPLKPKGFFEQAILKAKQFFEYQK